MGQGQAKPTDGLGAAGRAVAITGGAVARGKATLPKLPAGTVKAQPEEYPVIEVRAGAAGLALARWGGQNGS